MYNIINNTFYKLERQKSLIILIFLYKIYIFYCVCELQNIFIRIVYLIINLFFCNANLICFHTHYLFIICFVYLYIYGIYRYILNYLRTMILIIAIIYYIYTITISIIYVYVNNLNWMI